MTLRAGLLARGSSSGRPFPSASTLGASTDSGTATFVPTHSGGTTVELHHTSLDRSSRIVSRRGPGHNRCRPGSSRVPRAELDSHARVWVAAVGILRHDAVGAWQGPREATAARRNAARADPSLHL